MNEGSVILRTRYCPAMNMWLTDAAAGGCGGGLDFAPKHAIRSVGQCDVNIPSLSPRGRCSKAVLMTPGMSTSTGVDCEQRHLNVNYFTELT